MAGYSGTPLIRKLGIKPEQSLLILNEPDHYWSLIGELPQGALKVDLDHENPINFIHVFCYNEEDLHGFLTLGKDKLSKNGMIWVSWIKKASKNFEWTITDMDVRNFGLDIGLVDTKVCAFDEDWSGLKFMYRKKDR